LIDAAFEGAIVVVEWADRFPDALPAERLRVRFEPLDERRREVVLEAVGAVAEHVLERVLPSQAGRIVEGAGPSRTVAAEPASEKEMEWR